MTQVKEMLRETKPRVSKKQWLQAALDLLRTGGIEAVRVERLATTLGIAKSGFYYHFRDKADLHAALLDFWLDLDLKPLQELYKLADAPPEERLAKVAEIVDRADLSRYDVAIRQWARQDPKVRRIWSAEMKKRIDTIRHLFSVLGFEGDDLEMRTRLFVAYHVGERDLFADLTAGDRTRLRELRLRLLISA